MNLFQLLDVYSPMSYSNIENFLILLFMYSIPVVITLIILAIVKDKKENIQNEKNKNSEEK